MFGSLKSAMLKERASSSLPLNALLSNYSIDTQDYAVPSSIDCTDYVMWEAWKYAFQTQWPFDRAESKRHQGSAPGSDLLDFIITDEPQALTFDIRDVELLQSSRTHLSEYQSLDEMVKSCTDWLGDKDKGTLLRILEHFPSRDSKGTKKPFNLCWQQWQKGVAWLNNGMSHRFVAARYLAKILNCPVPMEGELTVHRFDRLKVKRLASQFDVLCLPYDIKLEQAFHAAMTALDATYYSLTEIRSKKPMYKAIFLPKSDKRSMDASSMMIEKGAYRLDCYLNRVATLEVPLKL